MATISNNKIFTQAPPHRHCKNESAVWEGYTSIWRSANLLERIGLLPFFLSVFPIAMLEKVTRIVYNFHIDHLNHTHKKADLKRREYRLILEEREVARKLTKGFKRAQTQMRNQPDHPNRAREVNGWLVKRFNNSEFDATKDCSQGIQIPIPLPKQVGVAHAQGDRPTMQDSTSIASFNIQIGTTIMPVQLYGIFDGHGRDGAKISEFASKHIQKAFTETLQTLQNQYSGLSPHVYLWNALKIVCVTLNQQSFFNTYEGGTTAAFALIIGEGETAELWTANVGDSRIVLQDGDKAVQLTYDQKADDPLFRNSIKARGGTVFEHRLFQSNGQGGTRRLTTPRRIGDKFLGVSGRAKITMLLMKDIQPGSHLILACDGIWDNASTHQIASKIKKETKKNTPCSQMAANIVSSSLKTSAHDNNTAMVVKIK